MSRFLPATVLIAALGSCQWPATADQPDQAGQAVAMQILELRHRIVQLRNRLQQAPASVRIATASSDSPEPRSVASAVPRAASAHRPAPSQQPPSGQQPPSSQPPPPTNRPTTAPPLATTLVIPAAATKHLESGAAWLASLPPRQASMVAMDNWKTATDQARTIKLFFHMKRRAAAAILAEMPVRLIEWGRSREHIRVYAPAHPAADERGYVLIRIIENTDE